MIQKKIPRRGVRQSVLESGEQQQVLRWGMVLIPSLPHPEGETIEGSRTRLFPGGDTEMERLWRTCRQRLLAESDPGWRPWAFNRFDLGIRDRDFHAQADFFAQLGALIEHAAISGDEGVRIDKTFPEPAFRMRSAKPDTLPYEITSQRLRAAERRAYWSIRVTHVPREWPGRAYTTFPMNIVLHGITEPIDSADQLRALRDYEDVLQDVARVELQARWHGYRGRHAVAADAWREADSKLVELAQIVIPAAFIPLFEGPA